MSNPAPTPPAPTTRLPVARRLAAEQFLRELARPLEAALWRYHFAHGAAADVARELARFQNPDGGFGHGLEPDLRTPASSAVATSHALQILRELPAPVAEELRRGALAFLRATYDAPNRVWPIIPPTANHAPHAPWWTTKDLAASWNHFRANPTAELAGYLDDPRWQQEVIAHALAYLAAQPDAMGMHELLCFVRLADAVALPAAAQEKLARAVAATVERDPAKWRGYGLRPLGVVQSPVSPYYPALREAVAANLDYLIAEQGADGAWPPTWSWGPLYPETWPRARREWQGVLTLDALRRLRVFDRLGA